MKFIVVMGLILFLFIIVTAVLVAFDLRRQSQLRVADVPQIVAPEKNSLSPAGEVDVKLADVLPATQTDGEANAEKTIKVYFPTTRNNADMADCGKTDIVSRQIDNSADVNILARSAMIQLFNGPTADERKNGVVGFWLTGKLASFLHTVVVRNGTAYLDWGNLDDVIGNASTSCGREKFFSPIYNTLTQFPQIKVVVHSINGSPAAFYRDFMEMSCPILDDDGYIISECGDELPF